jgi:curved DNA-binding protein CbpA
LSELDRRVPELVGGVDIRSLPLTALDGFVLSRIDGRTRVGEIVSMTGLPPEQVLQILERLVELGAARIPGGAPPARPVVPAGPVPASSSQGVVRGEAPQSAPYRAAPSSPPGSQPAGPGRASSARFSPVDSGSAHPGRERSSSAPPMSSSTPPRRRSPSMTGHTPRKVFAESSISGPPPDMRSVPPRARVSTPARPPTPVPPSQAEQGSVPREPRDSEPGPARPSSTPSARGSIPVTLPPLSLPPSMSSPPLFGAAPASSLDSDEPRFGAGTGVLGAPSAAASAPEPVAERLEPAALYDEKELDEDNDLPRERRKQVLDLYYRLSDIDYYTLLGVKQGADKKEIRSAYFSLSKAFHPDSMFRKELGSYKAKMTAVFQALTEAYEALSKKKTRDEYDAYLRSTRSVQEAERALATDEVAQADAAVEVPRPPPLPSTDYQLPPPTPIPVPPREVSAEAKRIARELIERRLRGLPTRTTEAKPAAPTAGEPQPAPKPDLNLPPRPGAPPGRQELLRQLGRTLMDVRKVTGSGDKLERAMSGAKSAFERGDIAASVQHMARAFSIAPERVDLHQEYERLSHMLAQKLADDYEEQAKFEMKQSKFAAAAGSWAKVVEGKPQDAGANRNAALCLLKAGGDLRGAQKYAQQAVFLAPNDIDSRVLLAQTYLTVGLKLNAKRELDAAAKLDPENEVVKNLLSDLSK